MTTVTVPWWLLVVLGFLVVVGALAVCWVLAGWAERAADWLRARKTWGPATEDEIPCPRCGSIEPCEHDELPLELPPERTWEQMTSHQLPLTEAEFVADLEAQGWFKPGVQAALREEARERRAPWWEAEQRQAYEALDLEFPSGLMARVREAAQ